MNEISPDNSSPGLSRLIGVFFSITLLLAGCGGGGGGSSDDTTPDPAQGEDNLTLAQLGQRIFEDENLSSPVGQSCASCHVAASGFADPRSATPATGVSEGAVTGRVGSRNAPTASYARFIPPFEQVSMTPDEYRGGQFLDGRASTLEEQAKAPFLNPLEMNNLSEAEVIAKLRMANYAPSFLNIFGANAFDNVTDAYTQMVTAIAAFERTAAFAPFSSKFDAVMATPPTEAFTTPEADGQLLFNNLCLTCHNTAVGPQVFSDFRYTNIGVPGNPDNPFLDLDAQFNPDGMAFVDRGLGAALEDIGQADPNQNGKFRTPTLRNVALTAPYMHNGVFDTLEAVIDFYDDPGAVVPEVGANIDARLVPLGLSLLDKANLLAFLKTLSDR